MAIVEGVRAPSVDVVLLQRVARGDEEAARGLIEAHGDALIRFVLRRTAGNREDAEEIVQDTFVSAVRMSGSFDGSCTVFTWLCSVARLKVGDRLKNMRRQKRFAKEPVSSLDDESMGLLRRVHDPSISLDEIVDRIDRVRLIQELLNAMSAEQREAVGLRYVEQFSIGEVARIMNRSEKAVERLLERAKERPRKEMLKWLREEPVRMLCLDILTL